MKIFDEKTYKKYIDIIKDFDKNKPKEFMKIFLRASSDIGELYIIYFCKNYKIYLEHIDKNIYSNFSDILAKLEIKIVDDNDDYYVDGGCEGYKLGPYYFANNIIYNERDAIVVNEKRNYFILMFVHTDGIFHACLQIIRYYNKIK